MRKIIADTHAHTIVSGHAYSTIREMASAAKRRGIQVQALTEHAPKMPGTCGLYYFQNLDVIPREMDGVRMLFGAELNIMDPREMWIFRKEYARNWIWRSQVCIFRVLAREEVRMR